MRTLVTLFLLAPGLIHGQGRGAASRQPATPPAASATAGAQPAGAPTPGSPGREWVRENYSKFEYRIPMRDGVKLFTSVYIPKDVFTDGRTYPVMMQRTPYNIRPYGIDQYPESLGPSEFFARDRFIFVYQDIRGRFMSEGDYT